MSSLKQFNQRAKSFNGMELNKNAGILDDFAVRKNVATKEGTIEKVPVNNSDITNKAYVDLTISNSIAAIPPFVETDPVYSANTYATGMNQGVATTNAVAFSNITDTALTSTQVIYASTGGILSSSSVLTFDGTTLRSTQFRVPYGAGSETWLLKNSASLSNEAGFIASGAGAPFTIGNTSGYGRFFAHTDNYFYIQTSSTNGVRVSGISLGTLTVVQYYTGRFIATGGTSVDFTATATTAGAGFRILGFTDGVNYLQIGSSTLSSSLKFVPALATSPVTMGIDIRTNSVSVGTDTRTAKLTIAAGATNANSAPLKILSGSRMTNAEAGAMEYDGNLWFTRLGTTRESIFVGNDAAGAPGTTATPVFTNYYGGNTNALGDPNSWASVVINGTTYKIPLYT